MISTHVPFGLFWRPEMRSLDMGQVAREILVVPRSFRAVALLLAALWLPATAHCGFENLGWDAIFGCATATSEHGAESDCSDDACQTLESGHFTFSKSEFVFLTAAPALACNCNFCLPVVAPPEPAPELFPVRQDETLRLRRTWQFVFRTAAPPRAPGMLNS
jgi:hypothetical protein